MQQWCDAPEQAIAFTRSRAYQSNDQAWVEQKNGVLIRRVVGYERLVGLEAAQLLAELYAALRLFTNLFQPSFKLKSSVREGGRIKRQHHPPRTPLQQLLRTGVLSDQEAQILRALRKRCDSVALLATMRSCQSRLALLISGQRASVMAGDPLSWQPPEEEKRELERLLQSLQALWRQSRLPQRKSKLRQGRRSRVDLFDAHADLIPQWLEAEADLGSQVPLARLIAQDPQCYGPQHTRMLQRRIRDWRVAAVQHCLESAAQRPETRTGRGNLVLLGVNQNGQQIIDASAPQDDCQPTLTILSAAAVARRLFGTYYQQPSLPLLMANLTLICLSLNRHACIQRSSAYWQNSGYPVIYADGSATPCQFFLPSSSDIHYLHMPGGSISDRFSAALAKVPTPYVCFMGDDEYYILSALRKCVSFLDKNPDYSSCMGRAIAFARTENEIRLAQEYPLLRGRRLSASAPGERIVHHFTSYAPSHVYAVTRTDVFLKGISHAWSFASDIFAIEEIIHEFIVAASGKTCVLPFLYWLRSREVPPVREASISGAPERKEFDEWWLSDEPEKHLAREEFCSMLIQASANQVSRADINLAFDSYVANTYGRALPVSRKVSQATTEETPYKRRLRSRIASRLATAWHLLPGISPYSPQNRKYLTELHKEGVGIDYRGLSRCLDSIVQSWHADYWHLRPAEEPGIDLHSS